MTPDPWCTAGRHGDNQGAWRAGCRCTSARTAHNAAQRRYEADRRRPPETFPIEPLLALLATRDIPNDGSTLWRLLLRVQARGTCQAASADKLAIGLLGIHPALVWGDAWWVVAA